MDNKELNDLIDKYIKGDCSPAELDRLLKFIKDYPQDERIQDLIALYWNNVPAEIADNKLQEAFHKTDLTMTSIWHEQDRMNRRRIGFKSKFIFVAASVVVLLSLSTWFWKQPTTGQPSKAEVVYLSYEPSTLSLPNGKIIALNKGNGGETVLWEDNRTKITQLAADEIHLVDKFKASEVKDSLLLHVTKGKKVKLHLGDGTIAWVNSDSQLKFPLQFGGSSRWVDLSGEAYFEVSHAAERPFYVQGAQQLVQVYGTRFNVRNYQSEDKSSTSLYEGRLSVRRKLDNGYQKEQMLGPGDQFALHTGSEKVELVRIAKDRKTVEWTSDRIYYENALLKEIFMDLSHQYVIEVDWQHIPHLHYQGYLPVGSDLDRILYILSRTSNINIKRKNNQISF